MRPEQIMRPQIQDAFYGRRVSASLLVDPDTPHLSPNHKIQALSLWYTVRGEREDLLDWFRAQTGSFMTREPGGYRPGFYEEPICLIVRAAWLRGDEEMMAYVLRWLKTYVAYYSLGRTKSGKIFVPATRCGNPISEGPWFEPRDVFYKIITTGGEPGRSSEWLENEWNQCVLMGFGLVYSGQLDLITASDRYYPALRDTLYVEWYNHGRRLYVSAFGPHEGGPWFGVTVTEDGEVFDGVSWESVDPSLEWKDVAHSNRAGFTAPRVPAVPSSWSLLRAQTIGPHQPVPPLYFSDLPVEAHQPPTDEEIKEMTNSEIFAMLMNADGIDGWGGVFRLDLEHTVFGLLRRKPEFRDRLRA